MARATVSSLLLLLALSSHANAQFGGNGGGPYGGGNGPSNGGDPFGSGGVEGFLKNRTTVITAHAICATVAFGVLFPVGGILIRLGSFRGIWLVHGLFQIIAYIIFAAAVALGLFMVHEMPSELNVWHNAHPIIGLVAFGILFLQPWLGLLHHFAFKKHSKRVFWSYAHIWIGRVIIAVGIINGGLGLQLSKRLGVLAPHRGVIIAYSVAAAVMYLLYLLSAVYGERKRSRARYQAVSRAAPAYKQERTSYGHSREEVQYA